MRSRQQFAIILVCMHPAQLVHKFLEDLSRLPLVFQLGLLYAGGAWAWQWWKGRKKAEMLAASAAWPVYRARVVWAQVTEPHSHGEDGPTYWEGLLTYSYTVPGQELEIGEHRKRFYNEDEADAWARGLRDKFVDVRVDPADAKRSVWQEIAILSSPQIVAPVMDAARTIGPESWGIREAAALTVLLASISGVVIAGWIQVSCARGNPAISAERDTKMFFGMHVGAILCAIGSGTLVSRSKKHRFRWEWGQFFEKGSAAGRAVKVLGIYDSAVFTYGWIRVAARDDDAGKWVMLMFSAAWVCFYGMSAVACWCAIQGSGRDAN